MAEQNCNRMTREEYRASVRDGAPGNFVCINCGKDSYRRISGTNQAKGIVSKYCCMACRKEYAAKVSCELSLIANRVKSEIKSLRRLGKTSYKPSKKRCFCKQCGVMYIASIGGGLYKQICRECSLSNHRASKRIQKAKRKAACKGAYAESVNPLKVFDRDKWRCKLCGAKTPKDKRGTCDDDAPELDHILPISKGGSHTYENTQCTCRRCNGLKSNKPLGQMWLIG